MARPMQTVKIYGVQDRRSTKQAKLPWVVRHIIDGRHRSKSFRTRIEAERYRGLLFQGPGWRQVRRCHRRTGVVANTAGRHARARVVTALTQRTMG